MSAFVVIVSILWMLRIGLNILSYAHLWWLKEYRFDRMLIHLHTKQGKRILFIPFHFSHVSPKSILLVLLSASTLVLVSFLFPMAWWVALLSIDLMTFPVTGLVVLFLTIPTFLIHEYQIRMATSLLRSHKAMTVIGITGSYGKTSTKEYLSTILSVKYNVLKTSASKNSPIGIAEVILNDMRSDHEIFVVEMGAYKMGEIARMSDMVRPQIGIVTAINPQHQDLFGSIENTMNAKYELIAGLKGKKIAIMNMDNAEVRKMAEWAQKDGKDVWFVTADKKSYDTRKNIFLTESVHLSEKNIHFVVKYQAESAEVVAPVIGVFQAGNITMAIAAAVAAGMTLNDAAVGCNNIHPVEKMMQSMPGINGSTFINDAFNNNPDAAIAAISYLKETKGKKFLVFQPMIELGKYADQSHENVGKAAGAVCDDIILTNDNFYTPFVNGVQEANQKKAVHVMSTTSAVNYLKTKVKKGDTVLFKSKESEKILNGLLVYVV